MRKSGFSCSRDFVEFLDKCPECESKKLRLDEKTYEFFCLECGFVIQEQIPVIEALHNSRATRVLINPRKKKMAVVLKGILRTKEEKVMLPFYEEIKRMNLSKQVEAGVIRICRKCVEKGLTRQASKLELLCAAVYIISKQQGIPVFFEDFEKIYGVNRVKIMRAYRKICRELKIPMKPAFNSTNYILRICSDLGYEGILPSVAIEIAKAKTTDNSSLLAAASICLAASILKLPVTQKEIARYSKVSIPALKSNFEKLMDSVDLIQIREYAETISN